MKTTAFIVALFFVCCELTERSTAQGQLEVRSECRDHYLWIQVASVQTPHFEAVDGDGVHSISEELASRCGYTISTFKMDGFTTFRASYYSCFTHNQNDEVFTFRFNVVVRDGGVEWISKPIATVCSGPILTQREIICEEDYMEVNVNRESSCGGHLGDSGQVWQAAFSQAQRKATLVWQLMFLQNGGQVSSMSVSEAQTQGYSLITTAQRVVLRSPYKQPHAEVITVDGIPVEVIQVSLFFKKKLMVMMIDVSMACTVNPGSFDGAWLLWDIPWVMTPLVQEGARFESQSLGVGVEGLLLDEHTVTNRGFRLVQQGGLVKIRIPFGAEGGYRKSLVVNNVYKEMYVIFLLYEHVFSLLYEDGSSINTRHRMLRVLDTPLVCHPPFSVDQTISDDQVFSVYLGNIPTDVFLEDVWINRKQMLVAEGFEGGAGVHPVVHTNGSRSYELRLPFGDAAVHWMYLGGGVVQYTIDINFTLTIMPQRDSYYHHTFITAQVFDAFPPEITAQCSDGGIIFSMVRTPRPQSLWEVGVDHEPLTSQLVAQRGYRLHNDTHKTTLEVPVFSIGYTYDDINLSNFYGTFKLLLRDSKTLEVQTSTSKRCLFKTKDMIVCSADGTMTVITTLTSTWPIVQPGRTNLLDPTCRPKQADRSRVLFEFKVDTCGTRAMVGESYVVYENEILHDRQMVSDGPNFISRDSQFKLTVRCFYPLSSVNRLSVDRILRLETPGFGSIKVFKSLKDSANVPAHDCSHQGSENMINRNQVHQSPATEGGLLHPGIRPQHRHGPSHFIAVPGGHDRLLSSSSQDHQMFTNLNLSPEHQTTGTNQVRQQVSSHRVHLMPHTEDQYIINPSTSFPSRYDPLIASLNTPSSDLVRGEHSGPRDETQAVVLDSFSKTPDSPAAEQLESRWKSSGQALTRESINQLSGLTWNHSKLNQDLLSLNLSLGMQELNQRHEAEQTFSLQGSSVGGLDTAKMEERPVYQPKSMYDPSQASQLHSVLQPTPKSSPDHISIPSGTLILPSTVEENVPADTNHKNIPQSSEEMQEPFSNETASTYSRKVDTILERTGSFERRNIDAVQPRVQNVRFKPRSKLMSSGHHLNHKPLVKQTDFQISGLTAVSNDGNHWTSQQHHNPRSPNTRQKHLPERTRLQTPQLGQDVHRVKLLQSAEQQGRSQNLLQSVPETGNGGRPESTSPGRKGLHPAGISNIRVRPGLGFTERLQTQEHSRPQNFQNPDWGTTGSTSRTSNLSFPPRSPTKTPANVRDKPTKPNASGKRIS